MKTISSLFLLFFCTWFLSAQVSESKQTMSLGLQNGFSVNCPDAKENDIEKEWKKYIKDYGKLNRNKKADEYFISNATIKSIYSDGPMDVYVSIEDGRLTAFFDMKSAFIESSSNKSEAEGAKAFLTEFANEVRRTQLREELEDEEDKLDKLTKQLKKLKKENEDLHQDIEDYKAKIKKAESDIITNGKDQDTTSDEISGQSKVVEKVKKKLNDVGKSE